MEWFLSFVVHGDYLEVCSDIDCSATTFKGERRA